MPAIKILGHRGSKHFPENTLPAFEDALKHADGFEFDVQYTKDEIPVVIHDDMVDRTTNGKGRVDSYILEELQQLSIIDEYGNPTANKTPTLEEVMNLADGYIKARSDIVINIEIKDIRATSKVMAMAAGYIENKGWKHENIIVSSFEHEALKQAKTTNEAIFLGLLYMPEQEAIIGEVIEALDPYAIHPSLSELKSEVCDPTECGKPLVVWIYGEKEYPDNMPEIKTLSTFNPMILITNYPKEVKKSLQ